MKKVIEIKNLKKRFGEVKAVDDVSFSVEEGELFAFLGLNGAGKSTTINIICGVYEKDDGEVLVDGISATDKTNDYKSKLGVVFQESALDKKLSVKDNLESRAALYGIFGEKFEKRFDEVDHLLHVKEFKNKPVEKLSGGQRRRADIARAIIHNPKILILDEPTTGLDPQTRSYVWKTLDYLRKTFNTTVFLTTHYMEEAADANNIVILDCGKIVAQGTPLSLKNKYTGDFIRLYGVDENLIKNMGVKYDILPEGFKIEVKNTEEATKLILRYPDVFKDYEITKGRIDDVFLSVTGKKLEEVNK